MGKKTIRTSILMVTVLGMLFLYAPCLGDAEGAEDRHCSFGELARNIATSIPAEKETAATIWPLSVADEELQPAAVIFEDVLLGELAAVQTTPPVHWVSRRYTELALQGIADSRRAAFNDETCPKVGEFIAARYGVTGRLLVDKGPEAESLRLVIKATIVDIEKAAPAGGGQIEGEILVTGPLAREMIRSIGQGLRRFTPLDEVDRLVMTGKLAEKLREADRAYDFDRNDEAMKLYGEVEERAIGLGLAKEHASIFYRLGNLYQLQGMADTALKYYSKALELDSQHYLACNNTGKICLERGDYAEAIEHLSRALEIKPSFAIGHYNRGLAVLKLGKTDADALRQVLEDFLVAGKAGPAGFAIGRDVEGNQKVAEAYYYSGILHHMLGSDVKAETCFEKAVNIDPGHASAHHELMALAYWKPPRDCEAVTRHGEAFLKLSDEKRLRRAAEKAIRDCRNGAAEDREQERSLSEATSRIRLSYVPEYAENFKELMSLWASREHARKLRAGSVNRVEMSVVKIGASEARPAPIRQGGVLRSGIDLYKIVLAANFNCWAYIWQLDSTGKVCPILPYTDPQLPGGELPGNPITPGTKVRIPGGRWWFRLDENVGIENIMFLVSDRPRVDIEELLQYFNEGAYSPDAIERRRCDVGVDSLIQSESWLIRVGSTLPWQLREDPGIFVRGVLGVTQDGGQNILLEKPDGEAVAFHPLVFTGTETEIAGYLWFRHVER